MGVGWESSFYKSNHAQVVLLPLLGAEKRDDDNRRAELALMLCAEFAPSRLHPCIIWVPCEGHH